MKCEICKGREGFLDFTKGVLEYAHGFTQKICRQCYIEIIETEKKKIDANLMKQKMFLKLELNENGGTNGRITK